MGDLTDVVNHPPRLAALRRLKLLDTGPSEPFDRLARLAARVLHCPIALVTLVDADRQYFTGAYGLPEPLDSLRQTPLEASICQYAVGIGAPLIVCDTGIEHWLDGNLAVTHYGIRAYAGIPLVTSEGHAIGTLCVLDVSPREWIDEELMNLADLAEVAMREIRFHRIESS